MSGDSNDQISVQDVLSGFSAGRRTSRMTAIARYSVAPEYLKKIHAHRRLRLMGPPYQKSAHQDYGQKKKNYGNGQEV